jgi:hypothetical protein
MTTKRTNKEILIKGLQHLGIAVVLLFAGPTLLHIVLSNKDKPFYIPLLIIAIIVCVFAVYFIFKGIITILKSIFD